MKPFNASTVDALAGKGNGASSRSRATPPTASPDLVTLADMLKAVKTFIKKFVVLTDEQATLMALWVVMTHALDAFDFTAYVHVTSPMAECGKSRFLEVLEAVVANPWMTGRVTAAVLMRKIERDHPTLLLDESDAAFNGDEQYAESLRGMLNAGFYREGKASCCVGQGANLTFKDFSVFGPKAIAGIGRLPSTVESRSIPIVMKRRTKDEPIHRWRRREAWVEATAIRESVTAAMARSIDGLRQARPAMPDGLSDRVEDVLEPLFAIADLAGGVWPEQVRQAAGALMGQAARAAREADQELSLELLTDIRQVFAELQDPDVLSSKTLLEKLVTWEVRPWATCGKNEKPITAHRVAQLLKTFGIHPAGTIRDGNETFKGYRRAAFKDAFARYLGLKASQGNKPNKTGLKVAETEASHDADVTLSKPADHPDKHCVCDAVTLSTPDLGESADSGDGQVTHSAPPSGHESTDATTSTEPAPFIASERDRRWKETDAAFKKGWR